MGKKVNLDIVTTTKIQATIDGKKRTLRMWRLPIPVPFFVKRHLKTYFKDAKNEYLCETRTPRQWIDHIKSFDMPLSMRGWVTSVIWFHYGAKMEDDLYRYYRSFDGLNVASGNKMKMLEQLDLMGISKVANELAAEREKKRDVKLKKIVGYYKKGGAV